MQWKQGSSMYRGHRMQQCQKLGQKVLDTQMTVFENITDFEDQNFGTEPLDAKTEERVAVSESQPVVLLKQ